MLCIPPAVDVVGVDEIAYGSMGSLMREEGSGKQGGLRVSW